jgi:L-tartrate/succinate antiporter
LPGGAIGLIGVALVTVLSEYVFFSPEQLAKTGFNPARASLSWALSGFSNTTVWLIFGAFMFALGYEKTGLGRRIALLLVKAMGRKTLTLGYAVTIADTLLAPFTPSNTARSGGTIYPVIRNLPPLYDSQPNDPSMRRVGSYLMWVAISATCVTSSMFLTAFAPNLLATELVKKIANIEFAWLDWFTYFAPVGILLLVLVPLLTYWPWLHRRLAIARVFTVGDLDRLFTAVGLRRVNVDYAWPTFEHGGNPFQRYLKPLFGLMRRLEDSPFRMFGSSVIAGYVK